MANSLLLTYSVEPQKRLRSSRRITRSRCGGVGRRRNTLCSTCCNLTTGYGHHCLMWRLNERDNWSFLTRRQFYYGDCIYSCSWSSLIAWLILHCGRLTLRIVFLLERAITNVVIRVGAIIAPLLFGLKISASTSAASILPIAAPAAIVPTAVVSVIVALLVSTAWIPLLVAGIVLCRSSRWDLRRYFSGGNCGDSGKIRWILTETLRSRDRVRYILHGRGSGYRRQYGIRYIMYRSRVGLRYRGCHILYCRRGGCCMDVRCVLIWNLRLSRQLSGNWHPGSAVIDTSAGWVCIRLTDVTPIGFVRAFCIEMAFTATAGTPDTRSEWQTYYATGWPNHGRSARSSLSVLGTYT